MRAVVTVRRPCPARARARETLREKKKMRRIAGYPPSCVDLNQEELRSPSTCGGPITRITRFLRRIALHNEDKPSEPRANEPSDSGALNALFSRVQ